GDKSLGRRVAVEGMFATSEKFTDLHVERRNPVCVVLIDPLGEVDKFGDVAAGGDGKNAGRRGGGAQFGPMTPRSGCVQKGRVQSRGKIHGKVSVRGARGACVEVLSVRR